MSTLPRPRAGVNPSPSLAISASDDSAGSLVARAPLVNTCKIIFTPPPLSPLLLRFSLQSAARELLPSERVSLCLRRPIPDRLVDVLYAPVHQKAHLSGLQVCASVWACPVCAAKISERRRLELSTGLSNWRDASGTHRQLLVTFTLSHTLGDNLSSVLALLKAARTSLVSGKAAQSFARRYNIAGMVRSLEVTHGANGWHPHLHVLYFFNDEVPIIPFTDDIKTRWVAAVARAGGSASLEHGCDVRFSDADIAAYVAKWAKEPKWTAAHELTKAPAKRGRAGGRTPMQLLCDYFLAGDLRAGELWRNYAQVFKGERQLYWSKGFRSVVGLQLEKSDEELAIEQEEIAIVLASLTPGAWRIVLGNDARGELLDIASTGDAGCVRDFLLTLGVQSV